ncbi:conserved Plasmodium protein, unknown function [Plasmodium gallinaceum]|uniref:Uncharacterized protein n=1 Tax=Plasmodium gallinaceum TaxID=5849 RepID=A0A1J1GR56_PLAGA|nr:conserved Plasmodium protein, unknown function [Plasmodium gallinaceum]CRG94949.1 conserved Plasmodium protein, unknown function [Plasmodium gallinaceum]
MEYLSKFYIKHIEKKSEDEFYDDKVRKIKMKNCCKKWSNSMNNKNIMIDYKKEIYESSFLKNMEKVWSLFFNEDKKGKLLLHKEEENIYSLPNFLIIDNINNNTCNNKNNNTNNNKCDDNLILDENDDEKISTNKNIYLNKKFIDIYHKHDHSYSFYHKEIDDFLILPDILTNYNEEINAIKIYDENFNMKSNLIISKNELSEDDSGNNNINEKVKTKFSNNSIINNENENENIISSKDLNIMTI